MYIIQQKVHKTRESKEVQDFDTISQVNDLNIREV